MQQITVRFNSLFYVVMRNNKDLSYPVCFVRMYVKCFLKRFVRFCSVPLFVSRKVCLLVRFVRTFVAQRQEFVFFDSISCVRSQRGMCKLTVDFKNSPI